MGSWTHCESARQETGLWPLLVSTPYGPGRPTALAAVDTLDLHAVTKREGSGLWVYEAPVKRPAAVGPERLRDPLRRFAARLYDDPDHVLDP
ncbi:hypothetical protein [Streptomyces sp. NPDC048521]|uniref:hypothetical protein n=1 Tax=Streptomyces sp. NPDC048521 TaxID=3365566 RepID=UPI0037215D07